MALLVSDSANCDQLIDFYNYKTIEQKNRLYNAIELDNMGMNYNNFFKLYHNTCNVVEYIDVEGLHILLCLLCHPNTKDKIYLSTTLKQITERVNFKDVRTVKKYLNKLIASNLIYVKDYSENIKQNDYLDIIILYNNNTEGFKPVPIEYFNRCLLELSPLQSAIVLYLIEKFKFFDCYEFLDEKTNKITYGYIDCEYAFPTLDNIAKVLNSDRHTIKNNISILSNESIISYTISNSKPFWTWTKQGYKVKNPNYRYRIKLLQRIEYNYYLIKKFDTYDKRDVSSVNKLRSNIVNVLTSSNYKDVKPSDWICSKYDKNYFSYFANALEKNDISYYTKNKSSNLLLFENFDNKNFLENT
jgi:hypothetical protein